MTAVRRITRSAGVVALFAVAGATAGGVTFTITLAVADLTRTFVAELRDARDVFEAWAFGGGVLLPPMLIAGIVMKVRTRGDGGASRWLTDSGLWAASVSAAILPLVLGWLALTGAEIDAGLVSRALLAAAILALSGWIGGVGGALATLRLREKTGDRRLPSFFD